MKISRRLLAMLLALVMILSASAAAFATGGTGSGGPEDTGSTNVTDIDPSSLHVKKLSEKIDLDVSEPAEKPAKYAPEDIVRVSIVLEEKSTIDAGYSVKNYSQNNSAKAYRASLKAQQAAVAREISSRLGKTLNVKWNLTLAVNIISAEVQYKDIQTIRLVPGVRTVFIEQQFKVMEAEASPNTANTSEYMVGATQAWATGYTGAGQLIAIVDSGIDINHQAFDEGAFLHSIEELNAESAQPVDLLEESEIPTGDLNMPGRYVSAKIPFAYNYVDLSSELDYLDHMGDDSSNHGSHVAGIAAANKYVPGTTAGTYIDAAENTYAVGMAPDAQLVVMKVFGEDGGAYESDYMIAIEDALVLGCASINLSLGSNSEGWSFSSAYQDTLNFLSSSSIETVLSISAGNAGNFTFNHPYGYLYSDDVRTNTVGSPGSYINSLTVASADNTGRTGEYLVFDDGGRTFYYDTAKSDSGFAPMKSIPGTYEYVYIDSLGYAEDYASVNAEISLAGKIVLINRGDITFVEKGNNLIAYNPKALIVVNTEYDLMGMSLDDFTGSFPMVLVSRATGEEIAESGTETVAGGLVCYTGSVVVSDEIYSGQVADSPQMSSFSSWGGAGSLLLKPEITAPGGFIYSVNGTSDYAQDYNTGITSYVNYSGTSMAAPHIAGLSAVLSQYMDENDFASRNAELAGKYSKRAIMQSLLMSTAEPMFNPRYSYYPVMQQGAGLVNVNSAISSQSVIMMGQKDLTLTAVTGAAADGKVKAELGDDLFAVDEKGTREFSFTIYNLSDQAQDYDLDAVLFTQDWIGSDEYGNYIMDESTWILNWDVDFSFEGIEEGEHDVNMDGKTDKKDAQAITDYLTGEVSGDDLDLTVADLDGDGKISSYDAYLILDYSAENPNVLTIAAGSSKDVTVRITPDANDLQYLKTFFKNGSFLEGYIYVSAMVTTGDGGFTLDYHSIPVYGFLGNWSDPSMFDANDLIDAVYGYVKGFWYDEETFFWNYSGNLSNYLKVTYDGVPSEFYGNPYAVEDEIPYDRFAINSRSVIKSINYNILRSAGTTGYAVTKLMDSGNEIIDAFVDEVFVDGHWYNEGQRKWEETGTSSYRVNTSPKQLGLSEDDRFRIGYYAMPEYYGIVLNMAMNMASGDDSPINGPYDGLVDTDAGFAALLNMDFFGKGSYIGYDFTVDDTAPVIDKDSIEFLTDSNMLRFSASDNQNIAYVAVMDINGAYEYWYDVPAAPDYYNGIDISEAVADVEGYIALFVADYAGNETAVSIKVNNNDTVDPLAVAYVGVSPEAVDVYKGSTEQLIPKVLPITADQSVTWESSDTSIVTVDEMGEVTGVSNGVATVTVRSKIDPSIFATSSVHVLDPGTKLNALLMDENSETYFVEFGAAELPEWTALHEEPQDYSLMNALNTSSGLIASTLSGSASYLFTVDTDTYEATPYAQNMVPAFDMAPFQFYGYDDWFFVYPYAYFLVIGDLEDGGGYANYSYNQALGGAWIAGIAPRKLADGRAEYFIMDELGRLWTVSVSAGVNGGSLVTNFGTPNLIVDTGIAASYMYQNLYFDGTYLYWSYYLGNTSHMVVFDASDDFKMYDARSFGKNIWPVTGFYMDGYIGGGIAVQTGAGEVLEPMSIEPSEEIQAMLDDTELLAQVNARIAQEEKTFKTPEGNGQTAEPADGGLNRFNAVFNVGGKDFYADASRPIDGGSKRIREEIASIKSTEPGEYFVPEWYFDVYITEEDIVTNGLYVVHYDPEKLVFDPFYSYVYGTVGSVHDDGNGTVKVAFASDWGIDAGSFIAYLSFNTQEYGNLEATIDTVERNQDLNVGETETVKAPDPVIITSLRLELLSKIGIRIYFRAPENAKTAKIFFENVVTHEFGTEPSVELDLSRTNNPYYSPSQDLFIMIFPKITSRQMTQRINFVVYDENDEPMGIYYPDRMDYSEDGFEYCAADWANRIIYEMPSPEAVNMAFALLNFGGEAQKYLNNYNPDYPANPWGYYAQEMADLQPDTEYDMRGKADVETNGLTRISLDLAEETSIRLYFDKAVTVKVDGKDAKVYNSGNTWLVIINGIYSRYLNHMYEIEVTGVNGTQTMYYSALSWSNDMIARDVTEAVPTAKALYLYHYAAVDYLGN